MGKFSRKQIKLVLLVALPLAIAAFGMSWNTFRMLDAISESVDQQEATRTWQAAQSAFSAAEQHLSNTVTDNARWDDAVRETNGPIDNDWMIGTWGSPTSEINYSTSYVVDATGKRIASFHSGEVLEVTAERYFGNGLSRILDTMPKDNSTFLALSTLMITQNGLEVVAAAPILPSSDSIKVSTPRPCYLIFAKPVTTEMLSALGEQYIVDGLAVSTSDSELTNSPYKLFDYWGKPVASVSWKARHPGDAARSSQSISSLATILALFFAMVPISWMHARALTKMDRDELVARTTARVDLLSGIPNRLFLLEALTDLLGTQGSSGLALMFIDLDGFKAVNDAYDHATGDRLIKAVAKGLTVLVDGQGSVARLGGDEFAILISGPDFTERSDLMAASVLAFVKEPFDIDGRIASIGASIGIAEVLGENLDPAEVMRRADIAMYDAKAGGRNRCRRFDAYLDTKRTEDLAVANEMRKLIAKGDFEVEYQPVVSSRDRTIIGVEALARWPKSSSISLGPNQFIPVAEEHGLIDALCSNILRVAFRDMAQWHGLRLAVNISPFQLNNRNLVAEIIEIARVSQFPLGRLEVELTETVMIKNPVRAKQFIQEFRSNGVSVALDDFGSGYASVGYLREFAFDKIKIDRSLTQAVLTSAASQQVVQGTVLIAKGMSTEIVAEGVESDAEARFMHLAGCQQLQGYYFGKPQSATSLGALLSKEHSKAKSAV